MATDAAERARDYRLRKALKGEPSDTRKGDRHKSGRKHSGPKGKTLSKWDRRLVVAWDGEGANTEDGTHIYNLLANSDGSRIMHPEGLPTKDCLDFFIKYGNPKAINVIYGGSYDVNMILRDVPADRLAALWKNGDCYWDSYRIWYAPRKKFTVQKFVTNSKGKLVSDTFTLWDVLGYFQATFVTACRKWLGDLDILDEIEAMKFQRNVFSPDRLKEIIEYNAQECRLLVKLMESLFSALDSADIKLVRYDGAGSIASALLRSNGVQNHKGSPPSEVLKWAQYAYSGGRIEAPKIGHEERPIYRYDINSAYPSSALNLPSYKDATWTFDPTWDGKDCSMVHVRWNLPDYRIAEGFKTKKEYIPFYPLWYREFDGTILYPSGGRGIYWGVEFRNLTKYYTEGKDYEVEGACNVHLANDHKPFAYLQDMYHARMVLKKAGNMAAEAFKLGMNSTYGKLAQQAGYRNGRIPTYHQLLWAGQITATTRSQLYDAAMEDPTSVIAFATDALITTAPLSVKVGTELGEWTFDSFDGITMVQPGVYWLKNGNDWHDKYRGFDKGSLLRDHIVGCWLLGFDYEATLTRFVGMGSALASSDFYAHWRTWETNKRTLGLEPMGKRMRNVRTGDTCYWDHLCDTMTTTNMHVMADFISKPYPLLWVDTEEGLKPLRDNIDLKILEDELMDSYA